VTRSALLARQAPDVLRVWSSAVPRLARYSSCGENHWSTSSGMRNRPQRKEREKGIDSNE
jgi:hypothetical protein